MTDNLLSVREVARACGRSEETVRRWIWSGKLPARKLGNQLFVRRTDLEALQAPKVAEARAAYGTRRRRTRVEHLRVPSDLGRVERDSDASRGLFRDYDYSPSVESIREHRGQFLPSPEEEARNIAAAGAFQEEARARFGRVDVVKLLRRVRGGPDPQ
jgi:excisionase family DNA binding protein